MSVITMSFDALMKMHYVDYEVMFIACPKCKRRFGHHESYDNGNYYASHHPRAKCNGYKFYSNYDILDWKAEDDQYYDIYRSMSEIHDQPIARVYDRCIVDGGHRLAVAREMELRRVLVETSYGACSNDSNGWYYGDPIDTDSVVDD